MRPRRADQAPIRVDVALQRKSCRIDWICRLMVPPCKIKKVHMASWQPPDQAQKGLQ